MSDHDWKITLVARTIGAARGFAARGGTRVRGLIQPHFPSPAKVFAHARHPA